jgi:beta-glucosidase
VPVAVVVFSGRPLVLGSAMERAGAVVAAWLPGTEGQGIADVLLGDYAPTGKLSFTWPQSTGQALFPVGYGLSF